MVNVQALVGWCAYALMLDDATGSNWRRAEAMWGNGRGNHQTSAKKRTMFTDEK